jgi:hypothetical protein
MLMWATSAWVAQAVERYLPGLPQGTKPSETERSDGSGRRYVTADMDIVAYEDMVAAQINNFLGRKDMVVCLEDNGPNIIRAEATEPQSGGSVETIWSVNKSFKTDFMSGGHIRLAKVLLRMLKTRGLV